MKANIFYTLAAIGAALFLTAACASEDTANKQDKENEAKGFTAFVESDKDTRTTTEYDGSGLNFYWTAGDRLWVNTGTSASPVLSQDVDNNIAAKLENNPANSSAVQRAATAKFYFNGTFTASSYPVRYTGKNGAPDKVTIKATQSQTIPNDASHVGEDGDFAVATATKPAGGGQYNFTLSHKAAYITFMPYTNQNVVSGAKIQKIRVFTGNTSDALAGTFDLADDGTLSNATGTSNSVELTVPDFSIPGTESYATNGATMVVNPGTYSNVSIEYTIHDPVTLVTGTITKTYPSVTFTAGRNKKVNTNLQVKEYPANEYYMWDAAEGQHFWKGYEWDGPNPQQPTKIDQENDNYAKNNTDSRWYNEIPLWWTPANNMASRSCKDCPNINELLWYYEHGDSYWDNKTLWATMGHLYNRGVWLKKLSVIADEQGKTRTYLKEKNPEGTDYRTTYITCSGCYQRWTHTGYGRPTEKINDYFYLPALGQYIGGLGKGILYRIGYEVYWWSSTASQYGADQSSSFMVSGNYIGLIFNGRYYGMRVWKAQ